MTATNKTPKTSRTRGAAKSMTEEKVVVPGQNEAAEVHPDEQNPIAAAAVVAADTATTTDVSTADLLGEQKQPEPIAATDFSPLQNEQEPLDDGLTEEERAVLNGAASPDLNGNKTAASTGVDFSDSGLDPKQALLALASSEIQGFGSNFAQSVITSAQENSKMAAEMIRQYPQLFYILTLQQLTDSGFTGAEGGQAVEMGKPHLTVLPGGMQSGYQQFQTIMTKAQQTVLSALPGTVLKQLPGQEEATQ